VRNQTSRVRELYFSLFSMLDDYKNRCRVLTPIIVTNVIVTHMNFSQEKPLWTPTTEVVESRRLSAYSDDLEKRFGLAFGRDYFALHRWSIESAPDFWRSIIEYHDLRGQVASVQAFLKERGPGTDRSAGPGGQAQGHIAGHGLRADRELPQGGTGCPRDA
jgi:hypothetical protein